MHVKVQCLLPLKTLIHREPACRESSFLQPCYILQIIRGTIWKEGQLWTRQQGMSVLQQELAKVHIPDFSGSAHSPLGKIKYSFHSMVVRSFQLPSSQISPVPNVGLKLSISGAFIDITGDWKIKTKLHISAKGGFDLKVEGLSISVGLKLGSDGIGRPTIALSDCSCHISDVKVHVSGKFGWLVDLFHHNIDSALRKAIENQVCPLVSNAITSKLEPLLLTLPVTAKIDSVAAIDYSLTGPPPVMGDCVDVQLKIPKDFNIRLNTSSFGALIPQLSKMYPNMLMKLQISSTSAPSLDIKPGNVSISPKMDIQAYAILPNASLAPVFLLNLTTAALAKVGVTSSRISGNLEVSKVQIDLKHSDVGPFSVLILNAAVNYYISHVLLPQVNVILNKGYPLSLLDHMQLTDVVLQPREDYLLFGANVQYGKIDERNWFFDL
ncbi:lipopolysaccharide-binding protein-like isoform X4 [Pseudophryne corroboree]|uniref:lipopolysaccharide-binding protein-like isoform X4 n=1 Tax=Pseudophryne corroboree TaxID=495146 RepID=UPI003081AE41